MDKGNKVDWISPEKKIEIAAEFAHKTRQVLETYKKYERQIINEPESPEKFAKLELIRRVIERLSEPVNYYNNAEAKLVRKQKTAEEAKRAAVEAEKKKKAKERVEAHIRSNIVSYKQEYNMRCRYYCQTGEERYCSKGMDMTFCGIKCAFATNVAGSTHAYETVNGRRFRNDF